MCSIRSVAVEYVPYGGWREEERKREAGGSWGGELVGVEYLSYNQYNKA